MKAGPRILSTGRLQTETSWLCRPAASATSETAHDCARSARTFIASLGSEISGAPPATRIQMPGLSNSAPACCWTRVRLGRSSVLEHAKSRAHQSSAIALIEDMLTRAWLTYQLQLGEPERREGGQVSTRSWAASVQRVILRG